MNHMSMVANAYVTNHNLDCGEIFDLLTTGFSGTLCHWWDKYMTEDSRESIKNSVKRMIMECLFFMKDLAKAFLMELIL